MSKINKIYTQNNTFITGIDPFHRTIYIYIEEMCFLPEIYFDDFQRLNYKHGFIYCL